MVETPRAISSFEKVVTSDDIKTYLIDNNASFIIDEYQKKQLLSDKLRREFVNKAVEYMQKKFGAYPKKADKSAVAKACVELLPAYKTENSSIGGIVSD